MPQRHGSDGRLYSFPVRVVGQTRVFRLHSAVQRNESRSKEAREVEDDFGRSIFQSRRQSALELILGHWPEEKKGHWHDVYYFGMHLKYRGEVTKTEDYSKQDDFKCIEFKVDIPAEVIPGGDHPSIHGLAGFWVTGLWKDPDTAKKYLAKMHVPQVGEGQLNIKVYWYRQPDYGPRGRRGRLAAIEAIESHRESKADLESATTPSLVSHSGSRQDVPSQIEVTTNTDGTLTTNATGTVNFKPTITINMDCTSAETVNFTPVITINFTHTPTTNNESTDTRHYPK